jgi:hypothetical protein
LATTIAQLREFALALTQAVHDMRHELDGLRVVHYWDTDSLFLAVRGARALPGRQQDEADLLVQSLYSAGFLGRVRLLNPHRTELLSNMLTWERGDLDRAATQRDREELLTSKEIAEVIELAESLEGVDDDAGMAKASHRLSQLSYRAFIYVQATAGTWEQRVTRLVSGRRLLDLTPGGKSFRELRETPEYELISETLDKSRQHDRVVATAIDAAALASLINLNKQADGRPGSEFPRFFTSSRGLRSVFGEMEYLRDRLSYSTPAYAPYETATVWRNSMYYFVRAIFPALALGDRTEVDAPTVGPAFDRLESLSNALNSALWFPNRDLERVLETRLFSGEAGNVTLAFLLEGLRRNQMSHIWLAYRDAQLPPEIARSILDLQTMNESAAAVNALRAEGEVLDSEVRRQLDVLETTTELFDQVRESLGPLAAIRGRAISLKNDLASPRIGVEYQDGDSRDLIQVTRDGDSYEIDPTELFNILDATELSHPDASLRAAAVLVSLEKFDAARKLLEQFDHVDATARHSLVHRIARVASREGITEEDLGLFVAATRLEWERLSDHPDAASMAVGYAYAMFLAWERSAPGGAWSYAEPHDPKGWIRWAVDHLLAWESKLTDLGQLQAVNLLVYMTTRSTVEIPRWTERVFDLERLALERDDFHVLDTVGFALLDPAAVRGTAAQELGESRLKRALEYLRRANALFPDDVDVAQHLELAISKQSRL